MKLRRITSLWLAMVMVLQMVVPVWATTGNGYDYHFVVEVIGSATTGLNDTDKAILQTAAETALDEPTENSGNYYFTEPASVGDVTIGSKVYKFVDWYSDDTATTAWDFTTVLSDDDTDPTTIYANWTSISLYTVTLNPDGGTFGDSSTTTKILSDVEDGTVIEDITDYSEPTKEGFNFTGWNDGTDEVLSTATVTADLTLTAQWVAKKEITVTLDYNGADNTPTGATDGKIAYSYETVYEGEVFTMPTVVPTKAGSTFSGWFAEDATSAWNFETNVALDTNFTLTATWNTASVPDHTVIFHVEKLGDTMLEKTVTFDEVTDGTTYSELKEEIDKQVAVTADHPYSVLTWYTDEDCTEANKVEFNATTLVKSDLTFYGKWEFVPFEITFEIAASEDGKVSKRTTAITLDAVQNFTDALGVATNAGLSTSASAGYIFDGWYTTNEYKTKVDTSTYLTGTATYYGQWNTAEAGSKTVAFDANGGTGTEDSQTVAYGQNLVEPTKITRNGYNLLGWYNMSSASSASAIKWDFATVVDGNTPSTLYAIWQKIDPFNVTIHIDLDGGEWTGPDKYNVVTDVMYSGYASTPTKDGYRWGGWYTGTADGSNFYTADEWEWINSKTAWANSVYVDGDVIYVYARWIEQATITFDVNGGDGTVAPQVVDVGLSATAPSTDNLSHSDSTFSLAGWYIDPECTIEYVFADQTVSKDITLYALWADLNAYYTVDFVLNGAEGTAESLTVMSNTIISAPEDVKKEGHTLAGWFPTSDFSDTAWNFTTGRVLESMTLYAKWDIARYTVVFRTNGGFVEGSSSNKTVTYDWNSLVDPYGTPERVGYIFQGWLATDADGEEIDDGTWDFSTAKITQNINFTAQWELDPDDGFESLTIKTPASPTSFYEGDLFSVTDLVVTLTMKSGLTFDYEYTAATASNFGFSITPGDALALTDTKVVVTYEGLEVEYEIEVKEKPVYIYVDGYVRDSSGFSVSNATLYLMQNGEVVATTTTDSSGYYYFLNVGAGLFNVYAFQYDRTGMRSTTELVTLTGVEQKLEDIVFPSGLVSTYIQGPIYVEDGLDEAAAFLASTETGDSIVKVGLILSHGGTTYDENYITAYKAESEAIAAFYDLTLKKNVSYETSSIVYSLDVQEVNEAIRVSIQLDAEHRYKGEYFVYRMHKGVMEKLTSEPNADGEYVYVNSAKSMITIVTKKFSTYAITYTDSSEWVPEDDGYYDNELGEYRYAVAVQKVVNGNNTSNHEIGGNYYLSETHPIHGTKVTIRLIEYTGYMVDYITAVDRNGNYVNVVEQADGTYYFTQAGAAVSLTVSFRNPSVTGSPDSYSGYTDVTINDWYHDMILKASYLGMMDGVGNGNFDPLGESTRAMVVVTLYSLAGKPSMPYQVIFDDVSYADWFWEAVLWANKYGITTGYNDSFDPYRPITREELAVMLFNYASIDKSITPILWPFDINYADDGAINGWSKNAIIWCTNKGVFIGRDDGRFAPSDKTTRAELATCLLALTGQKV